MQRQSLSHEGSGNTRKGTALVTKTVETQGNGSVLATNAVETQGKGSAAKAVETQGKGSVLPPHWCTTSRPRCRHKSAI